MLTPPIKALGEKLLGIDDFTVRHLRLLPYIQFVMMNNQVLEPNRINQEERVILAEFRTKGFIEGGASGLAISEEFWNAMHQILWASYVVRE